MKIAIVNNRDGGFAQHWINYCKNNCIEYKEVDPYSSDIIEEVVDCDAFMWHHSHGDYRNLLFAKQLLFSMENAGKIVFPNQHTGWHFDDKVGEKYMLEALGLPLVESFVFYDKASALKWAMSTTYPKVFKLRGGAGAMNVKLVRNMNQAHKFINRCFGKGFTAFDRWAYCKDRFNKWRNGNDSFLGAMKGIGRLVIPVDNVNLRHHEKGYAYFQEFMPSNDFDTRVVVVGANTGNIKASAFRRFVRPGDFRASGSGLKSYEDIDLATIKTAINAARAMKSQSTAFDFIYDTQGNPRIVETSYCFVTPIYHSYWDEKLNLHSEDINMAEEMIRNVIAEVNNKQTL